METTYEIVKLSDSWYVFDANGDRQGDRYASHHDAEVYAEGMIGDLELIEQNKKG
jgi:hypothetical protein